MVDGVSAPSCRRAAGCIRLVDAGGAKVRTASAVRGIRETTGGRGDSRGGGSRGGFRGAGAGRRWDAVNGAVPVLLGVVEAFADGDGAEAVAEERLEHVVGQVVDGLVDGVMLNLEPLGVGRRHALHIVVPDVLGILNEIGAVMEVALSVKVEVGDVVAEIVEVAFTGGVASRVGRSGGF